MTNMLCIVFGTQMVGESFHQVVAGVRTVTTLEEARRPKTAAPSRFYGTCFPTE